MPVVDGLEISTVLKLIGSHEAKAHASINFTPSENVLSPLARVPFTSDLHARYFFDWFRQSFASALDAGRIQLEVLEPILRQMARAEYVDVRPLSGMHCAAIVMAALCPAGGTAMTIPVDGGGHTSTDAIAARLGLRLTPVPMRDTHFVDLDQLDEIVAAQMPDLIYLDQSSLLFPIDPLPIRRIIDARSPKTVLHLDASHTNGLILGGALPNPLDRGAHIFGGSTHKTLPGPHKGFVATNSSDLRDRVDAVAYHFVSQSQLASVISLAITLLEMRDCGGERYAKLVLTNTARFAAGLFDRGIPVIRTAEGFTGCHQTWVQPVPGVDAITVNRRLYDLGIMANLFNELPGVTGPAFRISLAETTRRGGTAREIDDLIDIFAVALSDGSSDLRTELAAVRSRIDRPRYCYSHEQLSAMGTDRDLLDLVWQIENQFGRPVCDRP
ncbi:hypothetical protein [Kribbella speibonae]|uniref:hypothetical protein n=1 Tax=Kribbella speibonae TaxID=1572660 RepID=UPI0013F4A125|nr:hypothetical protein [Kribbella speibonae]